MRKLMLLLALCLVLTGCSSSETVITGAVTEVTEQALILETDTGERLAVLREKNSDFTGHVHINDYAYKDAPYPGVVLSFVPASRDGTVQARDGSKLPAYRTDRLIDIRGLVTPGAVTLADGTALDAWQNGYHAVTYHMAGGVRLLYEGLDAGPNIKVNNSNADFGDLSPAAQRAVTAFFTDRGKLYDLQGLLEAAYSACRADPKGFSSYTASQHTVPAAVSPRVLYFATDVYRTVSGRNGAVTYITTAFDRETGDPIPPADLFLCKEADLGAQLLEIAAAGGTAPSNTALRSEMKAAFRLEQLQFDPQYLRIYFPPGSLPSQDSGWSVRVPFSEIGHLMHPWAVPMAE